MLDATSFEPGTILWLPKLLDITVNVRIYNTVPNKCFGHPVLVLAVDSLNGSAVILILTTFGGSGLLPEKVHRRGHDVSDYLPIHPAECYIHSVPSLFLHKSQRLVRDNWVYIKEPYHCPKSWLQETWDENWRRPDLSRKIGMRSLHSLVLYARSRGFDPSVYNVLFNGHSDMSRHLPVVLSLPEVQTTPQQNIIRAANNVSNHEHRPACTNDRSPIERLGRPTCITRSNHLYPISERTRLLSNATHRGPVHEISEPRARHLGRSLWIVFGWICACAVVFGFIYGIYVGFQWILVLIAKVWREVSALLEKIVTWVKGLF